MNCFYFPRPTCPISPLLMGPVLSFNSIWIAKPQSREWYHNVKDIRVSWMVPCQGMFNFKGSNVFSASVCRFSRTLFLISSWKTGTSGAARSAQGWDHGKGHLLGFPSVTLYLKDYPFSCNWWNFILFNGWVIILLKIYKHAFLQIKYPCFTRDLGPLCPSSHRLQSPGPGLQRPWQSPTFLTSLQPASVPYCMCHRANAHRTDRKNQRCYLVQMGWRVKCYTMKLGADTEHDF